MMCAWSVRRSSTALQSRALVKTWGHSEKGRLVVTMTAAFSALSAMTWKSSSAATSASGTYLTLDSFAATCLFQLVSERYEKGSIILTSNKSYGDWGAIFADNVIASAILDRLLHHSTTINIKGESYRLKDKKKAGVVAAKLPGKEAA